MSNSKSFKVISPIDLSVIQEYEYISLQKTLEKIKLAKQTQKTWQSKSIKERIEVIQRFINELVSDEEIIEELSKSIGRPISQVAGELRGFRQRGEYMLSVAEDKLQDLDVSLYPNVTYTEQEKVSKKGTKILKRVPVGTILLIGAWNYPYLISVNGIVPSLVAGNSVLLKPAPQTFCVGRRLEAAGLRAGFPIGLLQTLEINNETIEKVIEHPSVSYVQFTGSVETGKKVAALCGSHLKRIGLELGGKDAAYVREDNNTESLKSHAENIADGICYNSGQSCCAVERVYVASKHFDEFVGYLKDACALRVLGDPRSKYTSLGPVVNVHQAKTIIKQINQALEKGAKPLLPLQTKLGELTVFNNDSSLPKLTVDQLQCYIQPQLFINVVDDGSILLMKEETFGPICGVVSVENDEQAIQHINNSDYGLTASIWTTQPQSLTIQQICSQLEVGTVFVNGCDVCDPALAWTAVKNSGYGVTLSVMQYEHITRIQSLNIKV